MMGDSIGWMVIKVEKCATESGKSLFSLSEDKLPGIVKTQIEVKLEHELSKRNKRKVKQKTRNGIFNNIFEMELRITLLLSSCSNMSFSGVQILAFDFINCYAKEFGLASENLQGDNVFRNAEMAGRRLLVIEAIKKLVRMGILQVQVIHGYRYKITDAGLELATQFVSLYAKEYYKISSASIAKYSSRTDEELLRLIQGFPVK